MALLKVNHKPFSLLLSNFIPPKSVFVVAGEGVYDNWDWKGEDEDPA